MEIVGNGPEILFDCVGAPGIFQDCIERAPKNGLIMGVGVCEYPDTFTPLVAFSKELRIQWAAAYEKADFEFTIENEILNLLQTRSGKRSGIAAAKIACVMVKESLITKKEAISRVDPEHLEQYLLP